MATDYSWVYLLIFLAIPLARIIPRILGRGKDRFFSDEQEDGIPMERPDPAAEAQFKPRNKEMLVLGQIIMRASTFGSLKKSTGLQQEELNSILERLEKRQLMEVQNRQGFFGSKVVLCATKKGSAEFHSYVT